MGKIMPFLRWIGGFVHGNREHSSGNRPALPERMPCRLTPLALPLFAAGAVLLALGVFFENGVLARAGAVGGLAALCGRVGRDVPPLTR